MYSHSIMISCIIVAPCLRPCRIAGATWCGIGWGSRGSCTANLTRAIITPACVISNVVVVAVPWSSTPLPNRRGDHVSTFLTMICITLYIINQLHMCAGNRRGGRSSPPREGQPGPWLSLWATVPAGVPFWVLPTLYGALLPDETCMC